MQYYIKIFEVCLTLSVLSKFRFELDGVGIDCHPERIVPSCLWELQGRSRSEENGLLLKQNANSNNARVGYIFSLQHCRFDRPPALVICQSNFHRSQSPVLSRVQKSDHVDHVEWNVRLVLLKSILWKYNQCICNL